MPYIRTIVVIDAYVDSEVGHDQSVNELCTVVNKQLESSDMALDTFIELADNVTIVTIPNG